MADKNNSSQIYSYVYMVTPLVISAPMIRV